MSEKKRRGTVRKSESVFIGLWVPRGLAELIDRGVRAEDSDRSKFLRNAARQRAEGVAR